MTDPKPADVAELTLAYARQSGDRRREALALVDLGILAARERQNGHAVTLLEEALGVAQQLNDRRLESETLGELGLTLAEGGDLARGHDAIARSLTLARADGDRYGEKTALARLGNIHAARRAPEEALACYRDAIAIARELGDRSDEADSQWLLAILFAEHGNRGRAVAEGRNAVELYRGANHPHAESLASALDNYERGAADTLAALHAPVIAAAGFPTGPPSAGPGLLRMALSAAKSVAKFIGSGLQTVPAVVYEQRLQTCSTCPHHTGVRCRLCGCFTGVKAKLPHERCPAGKWPV